MSDEPLDADELRTLLSLVDVEQSRADVLMNVVVPIGASLAYETEWGRLLERIVIDAMKLCMADGGVLYLRNPSPDDAVAKEGALTPVIVRVESMAIAVGGSHAIVPVLCQVARRDSAVADAANRGASINLPNAWDDEKGAWRCGEAQRLFDLMEYRIRSCLDVPLRGGGGQRTGEGATVIGVLRLFNARRPGDYELSPFEPGMQQVVESLCLLAATAVESYVRQQRLKDHIRELTLRIDENREVSVIAGSDNFETLEQRDRAPSGNDYDNGST